MAIAVKIIEFAQNPNVKTISLFAGDRDFFDAIKYAQEQFFKPVTILAFKENVSLRFNDLINTEVVLIDNYWGVLCQSSSQMKSIGDVDFKLNRSN